MAENGDISGWAAVGTAIGGVIAGLGAALGIKKKQDSGAVTTMADHGERIRALEANYERDRKETRETTTLIFEKLNNMEGDVKVVRAILDERKKQI